MLEMDQYEFMRIAHRVYGKSIGELIQATGHSRNTVRKALRGEPWGYKERQHQPFPILGQYLEHIDSWLEQDKGQPKKQRHTSRRVYNRLRSEHGYRGSESTVRRYVRFARIKLGLDPSNKVYIPCDPEVGREAEVDWGTAIAILSGESVRLKYFCMRSKYSGKHFVRFYPCERQQAFFDGHIQAFLFFGGVFPILIYDNLTAAVRKVFQGKKRQEQESFVKFRSYHNFKAVFCNRNSGHEKGGVEGLVGFARRNYMVPVPEASDIESLNKKILDQCLSYGSHTMQGRLDSVDTLFEQEKGYLLALPGHVFSNYQTIKSSVDKYSTVIVDKNRYSAPWRYAGFDVDILLYVDKVEIYWKGKQLSIHERMFNNNQWSLKPEHYLELIQQRPQSFNSARPIRQWREQWPESLHLLFSVFCQSQGENKGIKDFISVLMLYQEHGSALVDAAVESALLSGIKNSEGVRHIVTFTISSAHTVSPLPNWESLAPADIRQYGALGGVQ